MDSEITIIGAGPVGSLLAILLAKTHRVTIYEKRADIRSNQAESGRSINLIVTARGLSALELAGMRERVLSEAVPVFGRMVHNKDGSQSYQAYGQHASECNYSISRSEINRILLSEAERVGTKLHFEHELRSIDLDTNSLVFSTNRGSLEHTSFDRLIAADGANSKCRLELEAIGLAKSKTIDLGHGYKELIIPASPDGQYILDPKALHIWPEGKRMFMALPNKDGSLTGTLYLPKNGPDSCEDLQENSQRASEAFTRIFPTAAALIPELTANFASKQTGQLATVDCPTWNYKDKVLMIGDASHGIVPFFGQGMNSGFEDCKILAAMLRDQNKNQEIFKDFAKARKKDTDAIAQMSLENFREMSSDVADPSFLLRRKIERRLETELEGAYVSRYRLVSYGLIPYAKAYEIGKIQHEILCELSHGIESANQLDLAHAKELVAGRIGSIFKKEAFSSPS